MNTRPFWVTFVKYLLTRLTSERTWNRGITQHKKTKPFLPSVHSQHIHHFPATVRTGILPQPPDANRRLFSCIFNLLRLHIRFPFYIESVALWICVFLLQNPPKKNQSPPPPSFSHCTLSRKSLHDRENFQYFQLMITSWLSRSASSPSGRTAYRENFSNGPSLSALMVPVVCILVVNPAFLPALIIVPKEQPQFPYYNAFASYSKSNRTAISKIDTWCGFTNTNCFNRYLLQTASKPAWLI